MHPWKFKILYDGDCPFCVREINWLRRRNHQGNVAFEDIAASDFDPTPYNRSRDELMQCIHGVYPDGQVVSGMEVFRQTYKAVGLGWLLSPTSCPILRPLFDVCYKLFARNRVRLGRWFGRSCDNGSCLSPPSKNQ